MKRRLLVLPIALAGVALASGVASANPTYWRDHGLLLEVSADPRDGTDYVRTNPTRATRLELVALNAPVRLRGVTVRFADGRTFHQRMSTIRPGERVTLQLPRRAGIIQGVDLDYGRQIVERTPARLQIIPHVDGRYASPRRDHRPYARYDYERRSYGPSYYDAPSYEYRTQPSYTIQPRSTWSGTIQGSFRF